MGKKHVFSGPIDFKGFEALNVRFQHLFNFPLDPKEGRVIYHSEKKFGFFWDGLRWVIFGKPPHDKSYVDAEAMQLDQENQIQGYLYFDGLEVYVYLGLNTGDILLDYLKVSRKGDAGQPGLDGQPGLNGQPGLDGEDGLNGWTPILAVVSDGERRVQQVIDWTGGTGEKPGTGMFVGPTGFVSLLADGVDIRGASGEASGGTTLNPLIVEGLNASLADSPATGNRYVTVNLLNSYAYVQEAPINGLFHARKDGAWVSFVPFAVAGTPVEGNVVTYVSGVPTWAATGGGGSGNYIAYDAAQILTPTEQRQARKNTGSPFSEPTVNSDSGVLQSPTRTSNFLVFTNATIIRGFPSGLEGESIRIFNRNTVDLDLQEEISGISASDRCNFGGRNISVSPNGFIDLVYLSSRWRKMTGYVSFSDRQQTVRGESTGNFGFVLKISNNNSTANSGILELWSGATESINYKFTGGLATFFRPLVIEFFGSNSGSTGFQAKNTNGVVNAGMFEGQNSAGARRFWARTNSLILFEDLGTNGFCMKNPTNTTNATVFFRINAFDDSSIFQIRANKQILMAGVRAQTTDPLIQDALWNDGGTVKISLG
jgi:hypothetical protein